MERIAESVAAPRIFAELVTQGAKDVNAVARKKRQGPGSGARNDGAIDGALQRRAAPRGISVLPVGSGDAPVIIAVATIEAEAECFVSACCGNGVDEVVSVGVMLPGKVKPRVRILMNKKGVLSADVGIRPEGHQWTRESVPGFHWDWMGGRADGEQIQHH